MTPPPPIRAYKCAAECDAMVIFLVFTVVAGAILIVPFLLLHVYKVPKFPTARIHAFLEKVRRGHIAHRGGLPENTLSAFRRAKAEGASAIEVDLSFTQDGHPVLLHDTSVDRTSTGTGRVDRMTLEQLRELDFGCKFGPEFAGERLPTLHEAMDLCEKLDLLMFLELKSAPPHFLQTMKQMFQERPHLYDTVCIVSFWPQLLYKVRCMDPEIMCGLNERSQILLLYPDGKRRNREWWKHLLAGPVDWLVFWSIDSWLWRLLGISLLLPHKGDILKKSVDVEKWYKRDVLLVTWTVNQKKEKEYFDSVLQIPYLTDCCNDDQEAPEQSC